MTRRSKAESSRQPLDPAAVRLAAIHETLRALLDIGAEFEEEGLRDLAETLRVPYVEVLLTYQEWFDDPKLTREDLRKWLASDAAKQPGRSASRKEALWA